jgi:hypothetical protein
MKEKRLNMPKRRKTIPAPHMRGTVPPETSNFAAGKKFPVRLPFAKEKEDPDEMLIASGATTLLDVLSPATADFKNREYVEVDGVLHAYLYVTGYGYATTVAGAWLSPLVEAGEGISLNFTVKRQPRDKVLSKIAGTTMVNRSRMRDVGDTRADYEELDSAISAGLYLKAGMNRNGEDFSEQASPFQIQPPLPRDSIRLGSEIPPLPFL